MLDMQALALSSYIRPARQWLYQVILDLQQALGFIKLYSLSASTDWQASCISNQYVNKQCLYPVMSMYAVSTGFINYIRQQWLYQVMSSRSIQSLTLLMFYLQALALSSY